MELLPFAQLDLPGELPLADGRYLVRPPGEPDARPDVLVLHTLGAPRSRPRLGRRRSTAVAEEPGAAALPLSRVTLVKALPFADAGAAAGWLAEVSGDDDLARGLVDEVTRTVNRAMLAHRVSAPDPYAADVHPGAAAAVRFGYGSGEEVASGRWSEACELAEGRRRSLRAEIVDGVGAQERIAAVLGGREQVGADEALLLSAERSAAEGRLELAIATLEAALVAAAARGADTGEAASALAPLRERSRAGEELDPAAVRAATRAGRRAIRAGRMNSASS